MAPAIKCFNFQVRNLTWIWNMALWCILHTLYALFWCFQVALLLLIPINAFLSAVLFWPKFYWHLFGPNSEGRSIADIFSNPSHAGPTPSHRYGMKYAKRLERSDTYFNTLGGCGGYKAKLVSLNPTHARFNVFTSYQVSGAHSHLATVNNQVAGSLCAAMDRRGCIPYYNDPFLQSLKK
eukprot:scaffold18435_cov109-Skeletonema_dohrnii-CCMP3373.AAC.2